MIWYLQSARLSITQDSISGRSWKPQDNDLIFNQNSIILDLVEALSWMKILYYWEQKEKDILKASNQIRDSNWRFE